MDPKVSPARTPVFSWLRLLHSANLCRMHIRTILITAALLLVIVELGGIWREIRQMRNEQVKNATYALPLERRSALRERAVKRKLESTAFVSGIVQIDGDVTLEQPVEVDIDR